MSGLVDNLSEIYKKECELCKGRKIMSECRFIGLKNNELYYESEECNDESYKSINGLNKKFPNTYRLCNEEKVFIPVNTQIAGKNLMKHHYLIKKLFITN